MRSLRLSPELLAGVDRAAAGFSALCVALVLGAAALTVPITDTVNVAAHDPDASGEMVYTVDDWDGFTSQLTNETFWKKRGAATRNSARFSSAQRSGLTRAPSKVTLWGGTNRSQRDRKRRRPKGVSGTVRTVCVRLCDGYFWPVSPNSSQGNIENDRQICESSCSAPTRLFVAKTPTGSIDAFYDLSGRPYSAMRNAGAYSKGYTPSCKCQAHPWEEAAQRRHEMYAELKRSGQLKRYLANLSKQRRKLIGKRTRVASLGGGLSVVGGQRRPARVQRLQAARPATATRTSAKRVAKKSNKRWRRDWSSEMRLGATKRRKTTRRSTYSRRRDLRVNPFASDR